MVGSLRPCGARANSPCRFTRVLPPPSPCPSTPPPLRRRALQTELALPTHVRANGGGGGGLAPHPALLALLAVRAAACRWMGLCSAVAGDGLGALEAARCWARVGHAFEAAGMAPPGAGGEPPAPLHAPALRQARAAFAAALGCVDGVGGLVAVSRLIMGQELVRGAG